MKQYELFASFQMSYDNSSAFGNGTWMLSSNKVNIATIREIEADIKKQKCASSVTLLSWQFMGEIEIQVPEIKEELEVVQEAHKPSNIDALSDVLNRFAKARKDYFEQSYFQNMEKQLKNEILAKCQAL